MAIPLTGTGGLWTRLGRIIAALNEHNTARGTTLNARDTLVRAQFLAAQQDVMDPVYQRKLAWQSNDDLANFWKDRAQQTLLRMAQDDGWPLGTLKSALEYLRVQMRGAGTMALPTNSILKPTVTSAIAAVAGNVGNGLGRVSSISPLDGLAQDYLLAEDNPLVCTVHSYTGGGAVAGNETFSFAGDVPARTVLAYEWPLGSGALANAVVGNAANSAATDSGFEAWAGTGNNTPTNWTITGGVAGTTIFRGASPYGATPGGLYDLQFTGDAATLHAVRQPVVLEPQRAYAVNWWHKVTAAPGGGSVRVRLTDGAGVVVNDEAGNANSLATALAGIGVNYASAGGWFYTPRILPATCYLEIAIITTALAAAGVYHMDDLSVLPATQLYNGAPFVGLFGGSIPFATGDQFTVTTTNSFGTATLARGLDRLWDLRDNGVRIPSRSTGDAGTQDNTVVA